MVLQAKRLYAFILKNKYSVGFKLGNLFGVTTPQKEIL